MAEKTSSIKSKKQLDKKSNLLFIFLPLLVALIMLLIFYYLRTSSINGQVYSSGDTKIALDNVTIKINNELVNNTKNGSFNISGLKASKYQLNFTKEGYEPLQKDINLNKGENLNLNIYMSILKDNPQIISNYDFLYLSNDNKLLGNNFNYSSDLIMKNVLIANSKVYVNDSQNSSLKILDYRNGTEIKTISLPINFIVDQMYFSKNKDRIFLTNLNSNSIAVINSADDEIIYEIKNINSKVKKLLIRNDNRILLLEENSINWLNISNYNIDKININDSFKDINFFKNNFILLSQDNSIKLVDPANLSLLENSKTYKLNFYPEIIIITKMDKLYISSGKNLYVLNPETGNIDKTIDTGVNIISMKISPQNDNIYISDNTEKIYIFDTQKDEISKDFISFKTPVKEVFFPE